MYINHLHSIKYKYLNKSRILLPIDWKYCYKDTTYGFNYEIYYNKPINNRAIK